MKLWGGRFTKSTEPETDHFHSSISFDKRLYKQDIQGSCAHAKMLALQGVIPSEDAEQIEAGLREIQHELDAGYLQLDEAAEDIHMYIETLLTARIGQAGKRLHTGRSRNDQVALDLRMYVKEEIANIRGMLIALIKVLNKLSRLHLDTVMPGYTHLQRAQPITLAHHLCGYVEMFKRDMERLTDTYKRTDVMPLGSGALAATTYPLDREFVRKELGFAAFTQNSLDGVSDRDFCLELLSTLSILMMHLSRFCEEIVLWSSHEFRFIELDDGYATGSSIMPQKKNPDMAELIRGKTGRVYGHLMGLLTVMKGLPLAYNKDMQEDKEAVFGGIDTVKLCLPVFTAMVNTMRVNQQAMQAAAAGGFTNATDAADYLVKKGLPFREAHEIIGRLVLYCVSADKSLEELSLEEYQMLSSHFGQDIYEAIRLENCVNARCIPGGPAKKMVEDQICLNESYVNSYGSTQ